MSTLSRSIGRGTACALLALAALGGTSLADEDQAAGRGGWLGVVTRELPNHRRGGVIVTDVIPFGPADEAGMEPGDILVSVDSRALTKPSDVADAEAAMEPGYPIAAVVAKEGGRVMRFFTVVPAYAPEGANVAFVAIDSSPPAADTEASAATAAPATTPAATGGTGAAALGVRCANIDGSAAAAAGAAQGVVVTAVAEGSPAANVGIETGDVISWAGGQPVTDVERLDQIIATTPSPVTVVTLRRGTTRPVSAELATPVPGAVRPVKSLVSVDEASREALLAALRDEVVGLREEVKHLREEVARLAKKAAARP